MCLEAKVDIRDWIHFIPVLQSNLNHTPVPKLAKIADDFILDSREVLYRLSRSTRDRPRDMVDELRLVVPKALQPDILQYAHEDFQGGHQGITRTY
ncbi:Hypothetical protein PHPALM_8687 [Phytophthora palmivora]|uniref:Integrase zinc-binding domain-containing protein n=1 Tax=Phytophthora palmivora TaxID=4796 RepID=A0A2P4Y979_9STRA|nr:Hypothetical protein PHPALM_8687 [Phytophthora palmivora]